MRTLIPNGKQLVLDYHLIPQGQKFAGELIVTLAGHLLIAEENKVPG